jgi:hypothetical protein
MPLHLVQAMEEMDFLLQLLVHLQCMLVVVVALPMLVI